MAPVQVKNSYNSIGEIDASLHPSGLQLNVSVNQQSLRYFVISTTHQQVIYYGEYTMHHVDNATELAERITQIYHKDEVLQLGYGRTLMALDSKYSLLPANFTFMVDLGKQLSHTCGDTMLVFDYNKTVLDCIQSLFRVPVITHLNTTFFKALPAYLADKKDKLFVNVSSSHADIIRFDTNQQILLMNRYQCQTASDLIYFVLLCCDELKIDREVTELVLLGEVTTGSQIYDLCYRYFKNLSFINEPAGIQFSKEFAVYPRHLHFNLYNLSI